VPGSFEEFLSTWIQLRLAPIRPEDFDDVAERLTRELIEAAIRSGHRAKLTEVARPYRSFAEMIWALYETTEHKRKTHGKMDRSSSPVSSSTR
jgi:hypothetical protein